MDVLSGYTTGPRHSDFNASFKMFQNSIKVTTSNPLSSEWSGFSHSYVVLWWLWLNSWKVLPTSSVEVNFSDIMCIQTDKAAMSSPLAPTLGNIFVGYFEPKVISRIQKVDNLLLLCPRLNSAFWPVLYRKPSFSGQYISCKSFRPRKRKRNLNVTLVHVAFMICTKSRLK